MKRLPTPARARSNSRSRLLEVEHRKKVLPETALKYGVKAQLPARFFPRPYASWN